LPVMCLEGTVHTTGLAGGFDYPSCARALDSISRIRFS